MNFRNKDLTFLFIGGRTVCRLVSCSALALLCAACSPPSASDRTQTSVDRTLRPESPLTRGLETIGVVSVPRNGSTRITNLLTPYGQPAESGTLTTLSWNEDGLTVVFDCKDTDIRALKRKPDDRNIWRDDSVEIYLDIGRRRNTVRDNWLRVIVNARGSVYQERGTARDHRRSGTPGWRMPGLKAHAETTSDGWRTEIFMPWSGLGGMPAVGEVWGLNLARSNWPEAEFQFLSPTGGSLDNRDRWGALLFAADGPLEQDPQTLGHLFSTMNILIATANPEAGLFDLRETVAGDAPAGGATRVGAHGNSDRLTFVFDCEDDDIRGSQDRAGAEMLVEDDWVAVFLDVGGYRDPRSVDWAAIYVNAHGLSHQERGPMRKGWSHRRNPHTGWLPPAPQAGQTNRPLEGLEITAGPIDDSGGSWRAQIAMPWQSLGAKPAPGDVWGVNLARHVLSQKEVQTLSPTIAQLNNIAMWGHLLFLENAPEMVMPQTFAFPEPRTAVAPELGINRVYNGDFQSRLEGWTLSSPQSVWFQEHDGYPDDRTLERNADEDPVKVTATGRGQSVWMHFCSSSDDRHPSMHSRPFAIDPAYRYEFSLDMRTLQDRGWNAVVYIDGYRWNDETPPHDGIPQMHELQRVWTSRPLTYRHMPAAHPVEQAFAHPPTQWARGSLALPSPGSTVYEMRTWSEVDFAVVHIELPTAGASTAYGTINLDHVVVSRVPGSAGANAE